LTIYIAKAYIFPRFRNGARAGDAPRNGGSWRAGRLHRFAKEFCPEGMDHAGANFVRPILGVVLIQFVAGRCKSANCPSLGALSAARRLPEFNPSIHELNQVMPTMTHSPNNSLTLESHDRQRPRGDHQNAWRAQPRFPAAQCSARASRKVTSCSAAQSPQQIQE
jgi:hypothetical protein